MAERRVTADGRILERGDDGTVRVVGRAGGGGIVVPAPAKSAYEAPQAAADLNSKITNTQKTAEEIDGVRLDNATAAQQLRQFPISKEDAAIIDRMRQQADIASRAQIELMQSARASDRFNPSPERAASVGRAVVREDESLPWQWGRQAYGAVAGITPQEIEDYQNLDRYRQARVATIQQEQKGPQTESDAARYMKSTFGPDKSPKINASAVGEAMFNAKFDELRPGMYTQWANKYGSLTARNKDGLSVDEWYNNARASGWNNFQKKYGQGAPRNAPANAPRKNDGWKIERVN